MVFMLFMVSIVFKKFENNKCLNGKTQNNPGVNALTWKRCTEDIYIGLIVLEIGAPSTVSNFNDSMVEMVRVLARFGVIPGSDSIVCCNKKDKARTYQMNRKEMDFLKHQRKQTRVIQRGFGYGHEEKEEKTYVVGKF